MNKWISVKDKLPEVDELVLLYNNDEGVFRGYRGNEHPTHIYWACSPTGSYAGDGSVHDITHWMPLPEGPNE
jgi:hypothetical protein